ncbi:KAP family P-loop NTPase fold protein [Empedobacter falsenii]
MKLSYFNDKIKEFIDQNKIYIFCVIILIAFFDLISVKFQKYIVEEILIHINSTYLLDLVFAIFIFITTLYYLIPKVKINYYIKENQIIKTSFIFIFLIIIRFKYSHNLLSLKTYSNIYYFDILIFICLIPLLLFSFNKLKKRKKRQNEKIAFTEDVSIKSVEDDLLVLNNSIENVKRKIINLDNEESIAFGITGKWGEGKTSFMNLLKKSILNSKSNNCIIIDFNPWLNISSENIAQDFFNTIETDINKYSFSISKDIKEYGNSVIKLDKTGTLENIINILNIRNKKNQTEEFEKINNTLKEINKKVIVFIDDLDRLQPSEILNILKLIRNTANFYNFYYIVAYDKDYILESLNNLNIPNSNKYIEKIFVEEIKLLPLTPDAIKEVSKYIMINHHPDNEEDIISIFNGVNIYHTINFKDILHNIRDIKRFANAFSFNYSSIKDDVVFKDYLILQLIKFKYYNVYLLLFKGGYLIQSKNYQSVSYHENFLTLAPAKSDFYNDVSFKDSLIKNVIEEFKIYTDKEIETLGNLLDNIFPKYGYQYSDLSINKSQNLSRYFREELNTSDVTKSEFNNFINLPYQEMVLRINQYSSEGKLNSVLYYLYNKNYHNLDSKKIYENLISICFYIYEISSDFININYKTLWYNTIGRIKEFGDIYYDGNYIELKSFVLSILNKASYDFSIIHYCKMVDENIYENEFYNKDEFYNVVVNFFKNFNKNNEKINSDFWELFYNCYFKRWKTIDNRHFEEKFIHPKAIEIFKEFMKKDLDSILVGFVNTQSFYYDEKNDNKIGISKEIPKIFGSYNELKKLLQSKSFYTQLKNPSFFRIDFIDFMNKLGDLDNNKELMIEDNKINIDFPPLIEKLENSKYRKNF